MAGNVRVTFKGESIRAKVDQAVEENLSIVAYGVTGGARAAAEEIKKRGRDDIKSSGNFGPRWWGGLHVDVAPKNGFLTNARIDMYHGLWFAHIHEFGGWIHGKPLLWIPLSFARDALGIWARDYAKLEGGLFRVDRGGGKRPLLLSVRDKKPKYFGIEKVYIPQRWHLRDIASETMADFLSHYEAGKQLRRG